MEFAKYFEDYKIGEKFKSPSRTITEAHVVIHGGNSGDMHELQMDAEYAKKTIFGQRLVHAPLTYSIMEGLINTNPELRAPDANICYYGLDKMRLPKPVFIGDTITVERTVIEKRRKSDIGGIIKFEDIVMNQSGETVMICESLEYVKFSNLK